MIYVNKTEELLKKVQIYVKFFFKRGFLSDDFV